MIANARIATADRETLPSLLVAGRASGRFGEGALGAKLGVREVLVGFWRAAGDGPFPDFIVVRDEDVGDTYAWLSAYLSGLSPVTQWCRVWRLSEVAALTDAPEVPTLGGRLGPWVGAILAECSTQARMQLNLNTMSGTLALSCASFAAARAQAVWGRYAAFAELARRHDELSERLRARRRPVPAARLLGVWHTLAGEGWEGREPAEARALALFGMLLARSWPDTLPAVERAGSAVPQVTDEFDLPDLAACNRGAQRERVEALDRLGERLQAGPKSAAIDAIMGFAASLVEPGAAVMPGLLRRFETAMPTAQIWAGAFAGLWAPVRVLSDHGGLGRLVAKALLRNGDLFDTPAGDIAYDELMRWLPVGPADRMPLLRGMHRGAVDVELLPGVTTPFQLHQEAPRVSGYIPTAPSDRQPALALNDETTARTPAATPTAEELAALVDALAQRIAKLEAGGTTRKGGGARKPKG